MRENKQNEVDRHAEPKLCQSTQIIDFHEENTVENLVDRSYRESHAVAGDSRRGSTHPGLADIGI